MGRDMMRLRRGILLNTPHEEQASGAVASFATDIGKLKECVVEIGPVQDLHGYDSPWPPGGGKNLCDLDSWTNGFLSGTGKQIQRPSDANNLVSDFIPIKEGATYTYSTPELVIDTSLPSNLQTRWTGYAFYEDADFETLIGTRVVNTNASFTFTVRQNAHYIIIGSRHLKNGGQAQLELGSIATQWTPYENICPISGWSEAQIWNDPKYAGTIEWNQAFLPASDWIANSVQTRVSVSDGVITATLVSGKPNVYAPAITTEGGTIITTIAYHKYYLACKFNPAADGYPYLRNNTVFSTTAVFGSQTTRAGEWGSYENIVSARATGGPAWYIGNGGNTSQIQIGDSFSIKDLMCIDLTAMFGAGNEPSTVEEFKTLFPNDYYAYNAGEETLVSAVNGDPYREVTIDLDGTRYGGTVDVLTGKMVVDRALRVFNGSENGWQNYPNFSGYYITITEMAVSTRASGISNMLVARYDSAQATNAMWLGVANRIFFAIGVYESMGSTLADFKSFLSANNLQVVFPLATPIEITLSPTQLRALKGQNNIFADCGDTAVKYWKHGG